MPQGGAEARAPRSSSRRCARSNSMAASRGPISARENVEAVTQGPGQPASAISRTSRNSACRRWSAINRFPTDTDAELQAIVDGCKARRRDRRSSARHCADGGKGAEALAKAVAEVADSGTAAYKPLYPDDMKLLDKIKTIAKEIYRAGDVVRAESDHRPPGANSRSRASAICRSAWRRRNTASRPIRRSLRRAVGLRLPIREVRSVGRR